MAHGSIYLLRNTRNGKVYVGQTVESIASRWRKHKSHSRRGALSRIAKAIRKHGQDAFSMQELGIAESQQQLNEMEIAMVAFFNSTNGALGYNVTAGGDTRRLTVEGIAKMRQSMFGKKHTAETKQKIADAARARWSEIDSPLRLAHAKRRGTPGRIWSDASKKKVSMFHTGRTRSLATREKMKVSAQLAWARRKGNLNEYSQA